MINIDDINSADTGAGPDSGASDRAPTGVMESEPSTEIGMPVAGDPAMEPAEDSQTGLRGVESAHWIPLDIIDADPNQPRKKFTRKKLEELAESIRVRGVLQPIRVRENGCRYRIVAGERRVRAARMAGLSEIPAIVCCQDDLEAGIDSIVENLHRVDLNAMERADALSALRSGLGLHSWDAVGARVGLGRRQVMNLIGLYALPDDIQMEIRNGTITEKHGRALRMLLNENGSMEELRKKIREDNLTGDEALELARIKLGRNRKTTEIKSIRKTANKLLCILTVSDPENWKNVELLEIRDLVQSLTSEIERTIRRYTRTPY